MKSFRAGLLFSLMILLPVCARSADDTAFREANAKYEAGDYAAAASLYRKAIDAGGASAAYYNLGNADFRAGNKGAALVDYERAHALDPRDRDIEWNKAVLKNSLADRIAESDENVFFSSLERLLEWVTVDEAALLFSFLLAFLCLLSALHFFSKRLRSPASAAGGALGLLLILSGVIFYAKWHTIKDARVVILEKEVAARYGPSDKETKAFVLHEGALARVIDRTDSWYYIVLGDKNTGWVQKKSCEII